MLPNKPTLLRRISDEYNISNYELDVLELRLIQRLEYKDIAQQLGITPDAAHKRMGQVYKKLGIQGRKGKETQLRKFISEKEIEYQEIYDPLPQRTFQEIMSYMESWSDPVRCFKRFIELLQENDCNTELKTEHTEEEKIISMLQQAAQQSGCSQEQLTIEVLECILSVFLENTVKEEIRVKNS